MHVCRHTALCLTQRALSFYGVVYIYIYIYCECTLLSLHPVQYHHYHHLDSALLNCHAHTISHSNAHAHHTHLRAVCAQQARVCANGHTAAVLLPYPRVQRVCAAQDILCRTNYGDSPLESTQHRAECVHSYLYM